jgi:uroporphyrinogen decarboxylase
MNHFERIKATIQGRQTDYPPSIFIATSVACEILGIQQSRWSNDSNLLADSLISLAGQCQCDGIYITRDNLVACQAMGGQVEFPDDGEPLMRGVVLEKLENFQKLRIPDPRWAAGMSTVIAAAERAVARAGGDYYVMANIDCGPFSTAANLRGVQNFMMDIMTADPALIEAYLEFCTELVIAYGRAMQSTGVHGIQYGDSSASLVSADIFRRFVLPYQKKSIQALQRDDCDFWLHICGKTNHIIPLLADVPMQVFEVDALVPLNEARRSIGDKITLKGNLDTRRLMQEDDRRIYQATREMIKTYGSQGRLIVSAGCGVPRQTPLANLKAMTSACREPH